MEGEGQRVETEGKWSFAVLSVMRKRALSVSYAAWQPADGRIKKFAVSIMGGGGEGLSSSVFLAMAIEEEKRHSSVSSRKKGCAHMWWPASERIYLLAEKGLCSYLISKGKKFVLRKQQRTGMVQLRMEEKRGGFICD